MNAILDLFKDREGEGIAFVIAICLTIVAIASLSLIACFIISLTVRAIGINPQFWKMWVAGLSAVCLQNPVIYDPAMDTKLVEGWQLVQPVAIATLLILVLYFLVLWAKSRGKKLLQQVLQRTCMQRGGWSTWPKLKKTLIVILVTGTGLSIFIWLRPQLDLYRETIGKIGLVLLSLGSGTTVVILCYLFVHSWMGWRNL